MESLGRWQGRNGFCASLLLWVVGLQGTAWALCLCFCVEWLGTGGIITGLSSWAFRGLVYIKGHQGGLSCGRMASGFRVNQLPVEGTRCLAGPSSCWSFSRSSFCICSSFTRSFYLVSRELGPVLLCSSSVETLEPCV